MNVYQQVNEICRVLVTTCLASLEKIQQGGDKRLFLGYARKATRDNVRLVTFVKDYRTECPNEKNELLGQTLKVRDVVVKLLTQLRTMHKALVTGTPPPITSGAQQVQLLKNELKIVMKKVGLAAHQLYLAEAGVRPKPFEEHYNNHEKSAVECIEALAQMPEALRQRNRDEFTACTRTAITSVNNLLSVRVPGASNELRLELRENVVSFISHSKMYFVNPDDDALKLTFITLKEKVELGLRPFLPSGYVLPKSLETNSVNDSESSRGYDNQESRAGVDHSSVESDTSRTYDSHSNESSEKNSNNKSKNTEDEDLHSSKRGAVGQRHDNPTNEDEEEDSSVSEEILEPEDKATQEFSQSIVDKVKLTCPNDWEQLDLESKESFEKHIKQVLAAHKRIILALQAQQQSQITGSVPPTPNKVNIIHNDTHNKANSRPVKIAPSALSVSSTLTLWKNTRAKPLLPVSDPSRNTYIKQLTDLTSPLMSDLSALITHFNDSASAYDRLSKGDSSRDKSKDPQYKKRLTTQVKKVFSVLKDISGMVTDVPRDSTLEKVRVRVISEINVEKEGSLLPTDESLLAKGQYCRYNKQCLLAAIYVTMDSVLNLASQLVNVVKCYDNNDEAFGFTLLTTISSYNQILGKLLDDITTFYYLLQEEDKFKKLAAKETPVTSTDSIWNDALVNSIDNTADARPGTLNGLIIRFTSSFFSQEQKEHLNAFLSGYELFTTPSQVFEKLIDRYNVPKGAPIPTDQIQPIKMRCGNVLVNWLKKDMHSIDTTTLEKIQKFASTSLAEDNFSNISQLITQELESVGRFEVRMDKVLSEKIKIFPDDFSRLLLVEEKQVIAEQMTLIDFEIYGKIAYVELTDLKWNENKEKLHVMARNVINFIRRSNYIAFFVATNILIQRKIKDRVKLLTQFVNIAKCLADMHNYNSLMGILVGLGQASVDRLRMTWSRINAKQLETYRLLQQYFNPGNAFKFLREKLKASGGNALPYMGCVLGDLTFMDEGNPSFITEDNARLINFPKLHLINRSITEIHQYQKSRYSFSIKEPIYTILQHMPVLQDRELYNLSLEREPRQPNPV